MKAANSVLILSLTSSFAIVVSGCGSGGGTGPAAPAPDGGGTPSPAPAPESPPPQAQPPPPQNEPPPGPQPVPEAPPALTPGLTVFFMLDPRITTSHYMGERWVAPATFTLFNEGTEIVVDARAHDVAVGGMRDVIATWTPADPEMITMSSTAGHQVQLMVRREGQSIVSVSTPEGSVDLFVNAVQPSGVWRIDITQ